MVLPQSVYGIKNAGLFRLVTRYVYLLNIIIEIQYFLIHLLSLILLDLPPIVFIDWKRIKVRNVLDPGTVGPA